MTIKLPGKPGGPINPGGPISPEIREKIIEKDLTKKGQSFLVLQMSLKAFQLFKLEQ